MAPAYFLRNIKGASSLGCSFYSMRIVNPKIPFCAAEWDMRIISTTNHILIITDLFVLIFHILEINAGKDTSVASFLT